MSPRETRRIFVGGQAVELWESPDVRFDLTPMALRLYLMRGAWVTLFNAIALKGARLQAE
jgi:hypothetical protein